MSPKQAWPDRCYGALLRVLPFDFRLEFGSDMEEAFHMQRVEVAREDGFPALLRMWSTTIADIVTMAPAEHVSVLHQDVRYAFRMMRRNRGYTAAAVLILAAAIGVNTSIFSAVHSVLLKPLPYVNGDDLVVMRQSRPGIADVHFSVQELRDYRARTRSLAGLAEYHSMSFTLFGPQEARRVQAGVVSAEFFDLFGIQPMLGRTLRVEDDRPNAEPVMILSYEFWRDHQGSDPAIVGRSLRMNDKAHKVVGVLPPIPQYPDENDIYLPTSACPFRSNPRTVENREARMVSVFGRVKEGIALDQLRTDLAAILDAMRRENPQAYRGDGLHATASPLRSELTSGARPTLIALLGAAGFVLLIACANVANLTLARVSAREPELVIRTAMGAGSGRLLRQLLTESLILALLASAAGLLMAAGSVRLLARFAAQLTPRAREITLDAPVLGFAILCACATTIVFGSVAALHSRRNLAAGVKEGARSNPEGRRRWLRSSLIAAQVAFSYVLLIGAGLMVRSFLQINRMDGGFQPQHVLTVGFAPNWLRFNTEHLQHELSERVLSQVKQVPGVLSAAVSNGFPLDPRMSDYQRRIVAEGGGSNELPVVTQAIRAVSPDYFGTLGIPLLAGREFEDSDTPSSPYVVILNRELARRIWGDANAVGRRISIGEIWLTVVGVVGDTRDFGLTRGPTNEVYLCNAQHPMPTSVLVRTTEDAATMTEKLRQAVLAADSENAVTQVNSLEQVRSDSVAAPRTTTRLFSLFAGLAFLIALAGIGSMLALWVKQRTREIGIRVAMGAGPAQIVGSVMRQSMHWVLIGLFAGWIGSLVLTRFLQPVLFQVKPTDSATYIAVSALLLVAAIGASYVPAVRATQIDPQISLRWE